MRLYCCGCEKVVGAVQVTGEHIYPHRPDLYHLPFWQCPHCNNYVGTHNKSKNPLTPLGPIPTPEIREARKDLHKLMDPLWQGGLIPRGKLYALVTRRLGYQYHTASITSVEQANEIEKVILKIKEELT